MIPASERAKTSLRPLGYRHRLKEEDMGEKYITHDEIRNDFKSSLDDFKGKGPAKRWGSK
jgi:hypothetical protein